MRRLVATSDLLLLEILELLARSEDSAAAIWQRQHALAQSSRATVDLGLFDQAGRSIAGEAAAGQPAPFAEIADQPFFQRHRDRPDVGLLIGPTVFSPIDGEPYLMFSRRWQDGQGRFRGVATAAVRADDFLAFAEKLVIGPRSTVSFVRDDGQVLLRRPLTPDAVQLSLRSYDLFTRYLPQAAQGSYDTVSPLDGEHRFVLYRKLEQLPLIAVAGLAYADILVDWWRQLYQSMALALLALAAIVALARWGDHFAKREELSQQQLASSREQERLLLHELDHRARNFLTIVHSLVRQTSRSAADKEAMTEALLGRLQALGNAQAMLTAEQWRAADLRGLIQREVEPLADGARLTLAGPPVQLPATVTVSLGMMLHELATNAVKHGALSAPAGRVAISWQVEPGEPGCLRLRWQESGGPPVQAPSRRGFGTTLLEQSGGRDPTNDLVLDFRPSGLRAELAIALAAPAAS